MNTDNNVVGWTDERYDRVYTNIIPVGVPAVLSRGYKQAVANLTVYTDNTVGVPAGLSRGYKQAVANLTVYTDNKYR